MTVCPWDPPQVTCGDYPSQASYNLTTEGLNFDDLKTAFWLRPLRAPPRARRRAPERCNELLPFHSPSASLISVAPGGLKASQWSP